MRLTTVCLGNFTASLAMAPIAAILPSVTSDLDISVAAAGWIMNAYFLMLVGTVLVMGRLGDVAGQHRVFALGAGICTLAMLLSGLSNSFIPLVVARGLQGLGSAMILGTSLAIVAAVIPVSRRGRAIGMLTMASSASALVGVWISTWSVQHLTWHWAFFLTAPFGLLTTVLGLRLRLPRVVLASRRSDWAGAALLFATITATMLGLNHLHDGPETFEDGAPYHLGMHVLALALLLAFLQVEKRAAAPLLDFKLLRNRNFSAGVVGNGIAHMSMLATSFLLPFLLERGRGMTPADTGSLVILQQVAMVSCAVAIGYGYDRNRWSYLGTGMMALIAVGLIMLGLIGGTLPYLALVLNGVMLGASLGGFTTVNNTLVMSLAPQDQRGFASGLIECTRQLGHALGVSLSSSLMAAAIGGAVVPSSSQYVDGFQQGALVMGILAVLGLVVALGPRLRTVRPGRSAPAVPAASSLASE